MHRSKFIPARSSRHRTAALALYRALLRTADKVPVSPDLQRPGLASIVRKRVTKNSTYESYRLIYAAMTAGYKFLSLLTKAQVPDSSEHTQVINHLQRLRRTSDTSRAEQPPRLPRRRTPKEPSEPLLINVAEHGAPPSYTSNYLPRPASSFRFQRRIPSLCATADGQPFVRMAKPQPHTLSRMVGRKGKLFAERIIKIKGADEEMVPQAALEDEWDGLMAGLMRREPGTADAPPPEANDPEASFGWSAQLSRLWWEYKVETTWEDWVARGNALHKLVEEEKALLRQEEEQAAETHSDGAAVDRPRDDPHRQRPNVGRYPSASMPVLAAFRATKTPQEHEADPFISETWASIVRSESGRMTKWLQRGAAGRSADLSPSAFSWGANRREEKH